MLLFPLFMMIFFQAAEFSTALFRDSSSLNSIYYVLRFVDRSMELVLSPLNSLLL